MISLTTGVSELAAFQILTPMALLGSMLLVRKIAGDRGGSPGWQAAILLALGCALAATFGYTPVMVDPLLLLLTCGAVVALEGNNFVAAIVCAALGGLTKEYGLLLGLAGFVVAYRRGRRTMAFSLLLVPTAALLALTSSASQDPNVRLFEWQGFVTSMLGYHPYLFRFRGPSEYPKLLYMWSWSVLWPVLAISASLIVSRLRNHVRIDNQEIGLLVMFALLPLLLAGDWGRALLIIVPFGCGVATGHPLARERYIALLIAIGGLSTALARPFHSEVPPPSAFTLAMTAISVGSSLLLGLRLLTFRFSRFNADAIANRDRLVGYPVAPID
jgi:hypothetical protein